MLPEIAHALRNFNPVLTRGRIMELTLSGILAVGGAIGAHYYNIFITPGLSIQYFFLYAVLMLTILGGLLGFFYYHCNNYHDNLVLAAAQDLGLFKILVEDLVMVSALLSFNVIYFSWNLYLGGHFQGWFSALLLIFGGGLLLWTGHKLLYFYLYLIKYEHKNVVEYKGQRSTVLPE